jgi:hypothetical protein
MPEHVIDHRVAFAGFTVLQPEVGGGVVVDGACERRCRVIDLDQDSSPQTVARQPGQRSRSYLSDEQLASGREAQLDMFPSWCLNMLDKSDHARAPSNHPARIRNAENRHDASVRCRAVDQHTSSVRRGL